MQLIYDFIIKWAFIKMLFKYLLFIKISYFTLKIFHINEKNTLFASYLI